MKTLFYFVCTICISCGFLVGAMNAKHFDAKCMMWLVAFGIWVPFFLGWNDRMKKNQARKNLERDFQEFTRNRMRNQRR